MNIKRAKQEIKDTVAAYLAKDEFGAYEIPSIRQRPMLLIEMCIRDSSGGADSVCLLTVLKQLATPDFLLRAVHVHHGSRGAEADRDEAFAQKLCESLSVPLCVAYCHVPAYAAEHGLSEEEAGRILRYQVLEKEAGKWERELPAGSRVKIALAHHRDDNAETILHHLLRGSGLTGLAGIRPVQGRRIRPLLCVCLLYTSALSADADPPWESGGGS